MCALGSKCKIYKANFTDWMSFLPSNFIGQIRSNPKANANTIQIPYKYVKPFISRNDKDKNDSGMNTLI